MVLIPSLFLPKNESLEVTTCNFSNSSGRYNSINNCKKVGKLLFVNLVFEKGNNAPINFGEFIGIVANGRHYLNGYITDDVTGKLINSVTK